MVVQHNMTAINANRMLGITTNTQAKATEKLSSGYRINRAADDAAGLSISEKMRKQIRGLNQASSNAQDGISCVQTAEGALTEVHSMLQRMNELAVQASNGTMSEDDRQAVQDEINQLVEEIDRVSETTKFNETYLLKGTKGTKTVATDAVDLKVSYVNELESKVAYDSAVTTAAATSSDYQDAWYSKGSSNSLAFSDVVQYLEIDSTGAVKVQDGVEIYTAAADTGNQFGAQTQDKLVADSVLAALGKVSSNGLASDSNGTVIAESNLSNYFDTDGTFKSDVYAVNSSGAWTKVGAEQLDKFVNIEPATEAGEEPVGVTNSLTFNLHVGSEEEEANKIAVEIKAISAEGIGVDKLKDTGMMTEEAATASIKTIEDAITLVSKQRSALGAIQNRLEHTIANLDNVVENTTSAESRIRDTDMAEMMVEYSKNNILAQAGQSMLAQANQSTQGVLSLLQ